MVAVFHRRSWVLPTAALALTLGAPLLGAGALPVARAQSAPSYPLVDTGNDINATGLVTIIDEDSGILATIVLSSALPNTSYTVDVSGVASADCVAAPVVELPGAAACPTPAGTSTPQTVTTDAQGDADVTVAMSVSDLSALQLTSSAGDSLTAVLPGAVLGSVPTS